MYKENLVYLHYLCIYSYTTVAENDTFIDK